MTRRVWSAEAVVRALQVVLAAGWTAVLVAAWSFTDALGAASAAGIALLVACLAGRDKPWLIAIAGAAMTVAAVHESVRPDPRPLAGLVAGAALVAVPSVVRWPVARLLVPAGLLVAVRLGGGGVDPLVAVGLAAAAAALAVSRRPPAPVVALAALGALALEVRPAGLLLAAAAVLAASTDDRWVLAGCIPGVAALTVALAPAQEPEVAAVAVLLFIAALAACARPSTESMPWPLIPPLVALVLLPTTWTWVGEPRLDGYATGVVVALAGGALTAVAVAAGHLRHHPH